MAKYVHVILKAPKARAKLGTYGKSVLQALTGNATFAGLDLTVLTALLKTLDTAETSAARKAPGGATACAAAREAVRQELDHLRGLVQAILANQSGTVDLTAIKAMAESGAMDLRKVTSRAKAVFAVMYGPVAGSVTLTAPSNRKGDPHEWQSSADQVNWTVLPGTRRARTTVTGLPVGAALHFRHRTLTKDGYTAWSDPTVVIVVK